MANRLYLTVHAGTAPLGASLGTVDEASALTYQKVRDGVGKLVVRIAKDHPQAALLQQGRFVVVHSDAPNPIGAAWLREAPVDLTSEDEEGGEFIEWTGEGAIAKLADGRLLHTNYAPSPPASDLRGSHNLPGIWRWSSAGGTDPEYYGGVLVRAIEEGQHQPGTPLADVSVNFSRSVDTTGDPWDDVADEFTLPIGIDVLDIAKRITTWGVVLQMSPGLELSAYNRNNFGTYRAGAFAVDTVRFEAGVNVAAALQRRLNPSALVSHLLVEGADYTFVTRTDPNYPATLPERWGYIEHTETNDVATLQRIGDENIAARHRAADVFSFPAHDHGDDPATGLYEPGVHFDVGDSVWLTSGADEYDVDTDYGVATITWELRDDGDYDYIVELGSGFYWVEGSGTSPGLCCGPELAPPYVAPIEPGVWTWSENAGDGTPQQPVDDIYSETGLTSGIMNGGHLFFGQGDYWRSGLGAQEIPIIQPGDEKAWLHCAPFVPFPFSCVVGFRASDIPASGLATVEAVWYTEPNGTIVGTTSIFSGTVSGPTPTTPASATLTPPSGATAWTIRVLGTIDDVSFGEATGEQNPHAGTSPDAAHADHDHDHQYVALDDADWTDLTDGGETALHTHPAGSHPNLATHDALGLATDSELAAAIAQHVIDETHGGGGGGGGVSWVQDVNEAGASLASFTSLTGTWSTDGTNISQTSVAGSAARLRHTAQVPQGWGLIHEAEIRFPTTGAGGGSIRRGGLLMLHNGSTTDTSALSVYLNEGGNQLSVERDASAAVRSVAHTLAKDTWYKLRCVLTGNVLSIYIDGVLKSTTNLGNLAGWMAAADYLGLYTYGTRVDFRNVKSWTLRGGAPA